MNAIQANVAGRQETTMEAVIHRFQRRATQDEQLAPGEFIALSCCSLDMNALHAEDHDKSFGVYKAIDIGTVVGGTFLQKVGSFLKIKLANFNNGNSSY